MQITGSAAVMTDEEGTISGDLDVGLDDSGKGLVRYRGTDTWLTIGNLDAEPAHSWDSVARLAAAIEAGIGAKDAAGNTVPFEVFTEEDPAHANLAVATDPSSGSAAPASDAAPTSDGEDATSTTPPAETAGSVVDSPMPSAEPVTPESGTTSTDSGDSASSADSRPSDTATPPETTDTATAAPSPIPAQPPASAVPEAPPTETQPTETQPTETQPTETQPDETTQPETTISESATSAPTTPETSDPEASESAPPPAPKPPADPA